jgi:hypothetical protein
MLFLIQKTVSRACEERLGTLATGTRNYSKKEKKWRQTKGKKGDEFASVGIVGDRISRFTDVTCPHVETLHVTSLTVRQLG